MIGEAFDLAFDNDPEQHDAAALRQLAGGVLVGTTAYLNVDAPNRVRKIGGTYLAPDARGAGVNRCIKPLMIDRAVACGFDRIEFRVVTRNVRSIRATAKLGAVLEGVMRRQRTHLDRLSWRHRTLFLIP